MYIDVAVENKSKYTDGLYTYLSNDETLAPGDLVYVPFGTSDKKKRAVICGIKNVSDCPEDKIKSVISVAEKKFLSKEMVKTALWMRHRYGIKYYDAFKCFIPSGKPAREGKEKEPYKNIKGSYTPPERLTDEQKAAAESITEAMEKGAQTNFLMYGVTASGKTQVYMEAIQHAFSKGKSSIMLVPEISLTRQVIQAFVGRFGKENIAVLHSKLTSRERYDEWRRIKDGKARIVIGARMAVFAPVSDIGIIVMDEEQEAGYKADMAPKYDTVDIALKRVSYYDGILLLGSATPSVVSLYRVSQGIYRLLTLKERYNKTPLPNIQIADMRNELRKGNTTIFSGILYNNIRNELKEGRQCILLQNRRGYSNFVSCRECGKVMKCPRCGISLTYHKTQGKMVCHYCGRMFPLPDKCPECGSHYIKHFGIGTEQVEEAVKKMFPDAVTARMDTDTIKTRKDLDLILDEFSKGQIDVLIGTQLAAKGLDFDNVGLVGIIAADAGLNIPDYRSAERTFQLIIQAAGRAGRRQHRGKVIIQTYEPDNYALKNAASNDLKAFYKEEIRLRKFMDYPPFTDIIAVNFTADDEKSAAITAKRCIEYIEKNCRGAREHILGPRLSMNFKGKDSVRYYIMIKSPSGSRNAHVFLLQEFSSILIQEKIKCSMDIDINPYSAY